MMSSATSGFRVLFCTRLPEGLTGSPGTRLLVYIPSCYEHEKTRPPAQFDAKRDICVAAQQSLGFSVYDV